MIIIVDHCSEMSVSEMHLRNKIYINHKYGSTSLKEP